MSFIETTLATINDRTNPDERQSSNFEMRQDDGKQKQPFIKKKTYYVAHRRILLGNSKIQRFTWLEDLRLVTFVIPI